MKPTITWIVVADGGQARVFEHDGPGKGMHQIKDYSEAHLRDQDLVSDRSGRTNGGSTGNGSGIAYKNDPVAMRERQYVERLADVLELRRSEGAFQHLIIAAAPTALGDLRPALSEAVKATIIGELPKDLTNIPVAKLPEHFDGLVAL